MTGKSGSNDGDSTSGNGGASHDALGDTNLGRSLKELIKEIGKEKDAAQEGLASGGTPPAEGQDAESFDLTASRFDRDLAEAVTAERRAAGGRSPAPPDEPAAAESEHGTAPDEMDSDQALAAMETLMKRFAEAERRRYEQELAEWKDQLKKATMIVIKKQVDTARARWMQSHGVNQAKLAEQYKRLKILADKVARQKAQIQKAKLELEQKLEVADKLHNEFDEIRNVLGGQIGAIDALDKNDEQGDG